MATVTHDPIVHFPDGYDERGRYETPLRGYLSGATVELEDGSLYQLFFMDAVRLAQELQSDVESGQSYFAEPGLVILPEVTTESIQKAVSGLWKDGYFGYLKALRPPQRMISEDEEARQKIRMAFQGGDWQGVLDLLPESHHLLPPADALFYRGYSSSKRGLFDTGLLCLEEAVRLDPQRTDYQIALLDLLRIGQAEAFGRVRAAQDLVTSAIRMEGDGRRPVLDSAIQGFEGARSLSRSIGKSACILAGIGAEHLIQEFEGVGRKARLIDRSACILAGNSAEHLRQGERALGFYNEALRADPNDADALLRRGLITFESNREAAVQDLRRAMTDSSLLFPRYYLAYDAVHRNDYREGLRLCEEALGIAEPSDVRSDLIPKVHAGLLNWEACARFVLGEPLESVKPILARAAVLAPLDLVIRQNLDALERPDNQRRTAAGWRVHYTVDPHDAVQGIPLGRTA
jgi:tetratricopeptide (TPR) repeat protein